MHVENINETSTEIDYDNHLTSNGVNMIIYKRGSYSIPLTRRFFDIIATVTTQGRGLMVWQGFPKPLARVRFLPPLPAAWRCTHFALSACWERVLFYTRGYDLHLRLNFVIMKNLQQLWEKDRSGSSDIFDCLMTKSYWTCPNSVLYLLIKGGWYWFSECFLLLKNTIIPNSIRCHLK